MRLVSFGPVGGEIAGVLRGDDVIAVGDCAPELPTSVRLLLAGGHLPVLATAVAAWTGATRPLAEVRLGPPVTDPHKIICIGLNYRDHAREQNKAWPERPLLFAKTSNTLVGAHDPIRLPIEDCHPDYEVELCVVIGRRGRGIRREDAAAHIAGYCVGNDVSARRWQNSDGQWYRAKSCDTFFPCGPALVTADEVPEPGNLRLTTRIGDQILQDASSAELIHGIPALLAWISRDITLEPGDLISTGTPAGVGCFRSPPRWLRAGEVVECAIAGLGALANPVVTSGTA